MNAYERMRREFTTELHERGYDDCGILAALDAAAAKYIVDLRECGESNVMDVFEDYISACEYEQMAAGTIQNKRLVIGRMLETIALPVSEIRVSDLRAYLRQYRDERGISDRTSNKYREYFRSFFAWCVSEGYSAHNPAAELKPIRCEKKQKEHYTQSDLEYIRAACSDARDMALVEVLYSTGCRVSELCRLKKSDVDWNNRTVQLYGKGRKHRISYLNAKAEVYLRWYLDSREDGEEWLFLSKRGAHAMTPAGIQKVLRNIKARMGEDIGKSVTPHVFRHTTATTALRGGMPAEDIQALLGHENIETTMVYAETCDESVAHNHKKYVI